MVNPWVSPIIVVPKKTGEVRICVDMRKANKAVKREKHLMPTTDDLVADLNGATVFSIVHYLGLRETALVFIEPDVVLFESDDLNMIR